MTSDRISVPRPTQVHNASLFSFPYGTLTLYGQAVQTCSGKKQFCNLLLLKAVMSYNPTE